MLAWGFPNPIGWALDKVGGFVEGVATAGFELVIGGLVAWVVDAVVWVVGGVFSFFLDSTDPNVQADWFITGTGPYATTAAIGATLLVAFVLIGVAQGALTGDTAGMLRRIALDLPLAVLGMVGIVTVTQALIALTDALSRAVLGNFESDVSDFTAVVLSLSRLGGGPASAFVVFLLALVTVLAGIVLVAELSVRGALIYIVVALSPLAFAAQLWPALRGVSRKLLELLCALIVSKLVISVALAVAAAAAVGSGSGGEVTSLPEPEIAAEDPGGSVTQAVGILLTATAAFGVSAFSPLLIARLLPMTEAALVAQGVRSGPARAGQQAMSVAYSTRALGRTTQIASGNPSAATRSAGGASGASGGLAGGAAAAGGAAGVAAVGVAAVGAATRAARTGTDAISGTATAATDVGRPESRPGGDRSPARGSGSPRPRPNRPSPGREADPAWRRVDGEPDPPPHPADTHPAPTQRPPSAPRPAATPEPSRSPQPGHAARSRDGGSDGEVSA